VQMCKVYRRAAGWTRASVPLRSARRARRARSDGVVCSTHQAGNRGSVSLCGMRHVASRAAPGPRCFDAQMLWCGYRPADNHMARHRRRRRSLTAVSQLLTSSSWSGATVSTCSPAQRQGQRGSCRSSSGNVVPLMGCTTRQVRSVRTRWVFWSDHLAAAVRGPTCTRGARLAG
jgi:hypothetical protein